MIERIATVLCHHDRGHCSCRSDGQLSGACGGWRLKARAVLAAEHEPTEGMIKIGQEASFVSLLTDGTQDRDVAVTTWRAMIDAALAEADVSPTEPS